MALRSTCPINGSLEIFGDKWTLLILRDMMFAGKKRFSEFQASAEGIATNILTARLSQLEAFDLVTKSPDAKDRRKQVYRLTERGIALAPVLVELTLWGETHVPGADIRPGLQESLTKDREAAIEALIEQLRSEA